MSTDAPWATPSAVGTREYCARAAWYRAQGVLPSAERRRDMQAGQVAHAARESAALESMRPAPTSLRAWSWLLLLATVGVFAVVGWLWAAS